MPTGMGNKTRMRRKIVRLDMRVGRRAAMDFSGKYEDFGAPEIVVMEIGSIERISQGQIRVTYISHRRDENFAVCHLVWDIENVRRAFTDWQQALTNVIDADWKSEAAQVREIH